MDKLEGIIVYFLRNIYLTEKSSDNYLFIEMFFDVISKKKSLISEKCPDALVPIFFKCIRLISITSIFRETSDLQLQLLEIVKFIWINQKEKIFSLGRELVRACQELFKVPELNFMIEELNCEYDGIKLYKKLLNNEYSEPKLNPQNLILVQIPPLLDQYSNYILNSASKFNFNRHLVWMMKRVGLEKNTITESILIDYIRYILIKMDDSTNGEPDKVYRWHILGCVFKHLKSEIYRTLAKQALFFDWLNYSGCSREYKYFEPTWLTILNSINKYREMSEELLDFLFLYAKE